MAIWISIPVLGSLVIIQSVIASRIALLQGTADIVMLAIIAWALQKRVMTAWHWAIIGGLLVSFVFITYLSQQISELNRSLTKLVQNLALNDYFKLINKDKNNDQ